QSSDLQHIFEDNHRLATVRAQESAARSLTVSGTSNCGQFTPGYKFKLMRHLENDGEYLLTRVEHEIKEPFTLRSGAADQDGISYRNRFECLPTSLPYRAPIKTPRPVISGLQTAFVVGPEGQEIFVDKYGRVKVQFHWDRQGKDNASSSCWLRVAQIWAGNTWGAFFWPRVGHEVVVAFEEGDPDQPMVVGSVYNSKNMPPTTLPKEAQVAGIKSCIFGGKPGLNFNAFYIHDSPGTEYIQVHSETNEVQNSEKNKFHYVPGAHFQFKGSL
ncbi:MAG: type VI secretion system Vgr family protein, partial [Gemmataceae bacterium]